MYPQAASCPGGQGTRRHQRTAPERADLHQIACTRYFATTLVATHHALKGEPVHSIHHANDELDHVRASPSQDDMSDLAKPSEQGDLQSKEEAVDVVKAATLIHQDSICL